MGWDGMNPHLRIVSEDVKGRNGKRMYERSSRGRGTGQNLRLCGSVEGTPSLGMVVASFRSVCTVVHSVCRTEVQCYALPKRFRYRVRVSRRAEGLVYNGFAR